MTVALAWAALAGLLWLTILVLPWQPWRIREFLEAGSTADQADLGQVTALIPARNEAGVIATTLTALAAQGEGLRIVLIDDASSDGTAEVATGLGLAGLTCLHSPPLPPGWTGKLWALEQGWRHLEHTAPPPYVLLLDADIALAPGTLAALLAKGQGEGLALVSLLASPSRQGFWERLLMPAFVFFFKLLYPFALANRPGSPVAAAAGGCILMRREVLTEIGGFSNLRGALIDDCTLAARAKQAGFATWIGLTHAAKALRPYAGLHGIWEMVARTAFTQLRYRLWLLLLCTWLMLTLFCIPPLLLASMPLSTAGLMAALSYALMVRVYLPTLVYYRCSPLWALALPVIGGLFLAMTWTSALRYWQGRRSRWKGRDYGR